MNEMVPLISRVSWDGRYIKRGLGRRVLAGTWLCDQAQQVAREVATSNQRALVVPSLAVAMSSIHTSTYSVESSM